MTDNLKRSADASVDSASIKKRKALDELSEDGPLTQEDVTYFQKEAIWRQMNSYKRQCNILSRDLRSFKHKYEANESKLNILDIWYEQIINLLSQSPRDKPSSVNESLLIKITHHSDKDKLEDILNKRRTCLLNILSPILEKSKISFPESKEFIETFETLNLDLCRLKAENETILKLKSGLEDNLEELKERLLDLTKVKDRNQSKTLGRVDASLVKREEESETSDKIASDSNSGNTSNNTAKGASDTDNIENKEAPVDNSADKELIETLTVNLKELEASNATLQQQITELSRKHQKSSEDCLELASRLSSLSSKDLNLSPIYQSILNKNKVLSEQVEDLVKVQSILVAKLSQLENARGNLKNLIDETLSFENNNLKQTLAKVESDLVRIRTSRDELIAKNSILKSESENKSLITELEKLVSVQKEKINSLTNERVVNNESKEEEVQKLKSLTSDELIKRITMLSGEIKEIESVFQSTHEIAVKKLHNEVENDNLIKKLTIEKTKADQKYFAAMRSKDAIASENKVLKSQIAKSQELVSKLNDLEKTYLTKISILQKSEIDFKTIKENSLQENSKLQEQIKSIQASRERFENETKSLKKTLEGKVSQLGALDVERNDALQKLARVEAKVKELESLIKKYRSNKTSSILQEDERQLEALRSIAKCSLCSKNWKDTAITVCGHVFCSDCAQERLAARLRRCPSCNKGFSANDLLSIHL